MRRLASVLALLLVSAACSGEGAEPVDRLVVVDREGRVVTVEPDGSDLTMLSGGRGHVSLPAGVVPGRRLDRLGLDEGFGFRAWLSPTSARERSRWPRWRRTRSTCRGRRWVTVSGCCATTVPGWPSRPPPSTRTA